MIDSLRGEYSAVHHHPNFLLGALLRGIEDRQDGHPKEDAQICGYEEDDFKERRQIEGEYHQASREAAKTQGRR